MESGIPLVDKEYLLEKFPGKGGWTFALIPEVEPNKKAHFGLVRVKGNIEGYPLKGYKLMPMGEGKLFLPVKAEIRKKIGKQAGDVVRIILYADEVPLEVPEELLACFAMEPPQAYQAFLKLKEWEQKSYLDWIFDAKKEDTKAERILKMMDRLLQQNKSL
jgi:hypothetical protein